MKVSDLVIETFKDCIKGIIFSRQEIIKKVSEKFDVNESSIIPSDYCYNRWNKGVSETKRLCLFEYIDTTDEKKYRYLGQDCSYNGKVYHKARGDVEKCVGEWVDGKWFKFEDSNKNNNLNHKELQEVHMQTVFTTNKDYPLTTLKEMVEEGDIITDPDYQRDYVYDDGKASKLIESILIGIPIPRVYFCQEDDECLTVIDGQQRITSFIRYLSNEFKLKGLTELTDINGKYYKELDKNLQKKLKSASLNAVCLLKESKELKYEIFARLNQGAVSLNPQELRNCLYRGEFNLLLNELADNKNLPTMFIDSNKRKSYQERILRFFALRNFTDYKSSLLKSMNAYMEGHQNPSDKELAEMKSLFNSTLDLVKQILGDKAFVAIDREKDLDKFSGPVYDSVMVGFSFFTAHDLMAHADAIRLAIKNLRDTDQEYFEYTYVNSGSKKNVAGRILKVYNLLSTITGSFGHDDSRCFDDEVKKKLYYPGYKCNYCGNEILSIDDCEVDHIFAYANGGKTDESNAQLLHRTCNRMKSDKVLP